MRGGVRSGPAGCARIEHAYRELKDAPSPDHFEGRSYRGWHHHVRLVSVAYAFLTWNADARDPGRQPEPVRAPTPDRLLNGRLPDLPRTDVVHDRILRAHPELTEQY